jgi:phosphatidate phosphatase PAH1
MWERIRDDCSTTACGVLFFAGGGVKVAFQRCGVPEGRIFLVGKSGEIQSANRTLRKSFDQINSVLHEMFPPIAGDLNIPKYRGVP